jgi:hypothetical protein
VPRNAQGNPGYPGKSEARRAHQALRTERITKDGRRIIVSITISPSLALTAASSVLDHRPRHHREQAGRGLKKSQFILAKSQEMPTWATGPGTSRPTRPSSPTRVPHLRLQATGAQPDLQWLPAGPAGRPGDGS